MILGISSLEIDSKLSASFNGSDFGVVVDDVSFEFVEFLLSVSNGYRKYTPMDINKQVKSVALVTTAILRVDQLKLLDMARILMKLFLDSELESQ